LFPLEREGQTGVSVLRGRSAEGRECGRRIQARREILDKSPHGGVPEAVEAEEVHFFGGLLGGPFFDGHAIDGGENAGAIVAEAAVHEDFLPGIVAEEREKLDDLFVGWRIPATNGNVDKAHAHGFGMRALPHDFFAVFAAQIDDGGDAQQFQLRETHFPGLRAAIQDIVDFSGVGNSGDLDFLAVSRLGEGRSGSLRRRLSGSLRKKRKRKKENEGEGGEGAFHIELDATSVA
jgi:hypothetical protein